MNKISLKLKIYIYSGLTAVIIGGIIIFFIYPYYKEINKFSDQIYDNRVKLAIYEQQRENIETTRQDYNKIKNDLDKISKIFINQNEILDLISSFELIATNNEIAQNIDIKPNDNEIAETFNFEITASGNWNNLLLYFSNLEHLDYFVEISNLNILEQNNQITLNFSASIPIKQLD
ncbi:MAG: type 4a pilus biogenesis protein PilO [Patescibacteria group bacterium]|jgi:Tfp pilus assembly protein PilO